MTLADILKTEFSPEFVRFMEHRMAISFHKYGPLTQGFPDKIDALGSARDRMRKYTSTGNKEYLVDAANFLMIEFMLPRHPNAHFTAQDSEYSPGRRELGTGLLTQRRNDEI
jgi:hypothetical protein